MPNAMPPDFHSKTTIGTDCSLRVFAFASMIRTTCRPRFHPCLLLSRFLRRPLCLRDYVRLASFPRFASGTAWVHLQKSTTRGSLPIRGVPATSWKASRPRKAVDPFLRLRSRGLFCFFFSRALRQWHRGNIALIATLPVIGCLNLVQHMQPRCLEDSFLPPQNKEKRHC